MDEIPPPGRWVAAHDIEEASLQVDSARDALRTAYYRLQRARLTLLGVGGEEQERNAGDYAGYLETFEAYRTELDRIKKLLEHDVEAMRRQARQR